MHGPQQWKFVQSFKLYPVINVMRVFRGINSMELGTDRKIFQSKTKKKHCIIIVNDVARNQDVIPGKLTQHAVYLYNCILLFL